MGLSSHSLQPPQKSIVFVCVIRMGRETDQNHSQNLKYTHNETLDRLRKKKTRNTNTHNIKVNYMLLINRNWNEEIKTTTTTTH